MSSRLAIVAAALFIVVGCQTTTGRTAGTFIDDSATTATVKGKLAADRPATLTSVGVKMVSGVTYLTGVVDTPQQRMRAEQLAWEVDGVRQVVNNIQVERRSAAADPSAAVPESTVLRDAVVGTVSSVDTDRSQVTIKTGTEQLLLQLPSGVIQDLRPGDRISLDVNVRPAR